MGTARKTVVCNVDGSEVVILTSRTKTMCGIKGSTLVGASVFRVCLRGFGRPAEPLPGRV